MEKRKRKKSPHISRKIHAEKQGALERFFWAALIGALAVLLAYNLASTPLFNGQLAEKRATQKAEYEEVKGEITKYEELLFKYPGYRDAYIKLAILSWKIGQNEKAKEYLKTALGIDPNNETAIALSRRWGLE